MARSVFLFAAGFIFSLSVFSQTTFTKYDTLRGALSPLRACFDVHYYNLDIAIDIEDRSIKGSNEIYFHTILPTKSIQLDLFSNMQIDSVCMNRTKLLFDRDSNTFFVHFNTLLEQNTSHSITVYYGGNPIIAKKAPWDGGWVFTRDSLERPWVGVACEGIGASLWWPLKDHLSDEPDSMRMTYTVPADLMAVGNGNLEQKDEASLGVASYTWKVSYPINSYNVTCNIAHYTHIHDQHIQLDNDTLEIDYYVLDYNKEKAQRHFQQVHPMLTCYEHYFGPYPFQKDGYAMVETPYWGMEHQGAIAYGNNYTNQIIVFDYIIIHESGHEWWGNNVSTTDHAEMWIHESFTTYTENLLIEYYYGYDMSVRYLNLNKNRIKNKDPIVGPKGVNYDNWQGSDMYYKGAWILHTFRNTLGNDSLWYSILKGIQTEYALKTITTDTLINYINSRAGQDYTWFFKQYLYQAEPPILNYYFEKKHSKTILHYKWENTNADFKMPIYVYLDNDKITTISPSKSYQSIEYKTHKMKLDLFDLNSFYYLLKTTQKVMMKKLTASIILLIVSATTAFCQLGTSEQKNWGLGLKLGDPTGFTAKKYFSNNGGLEFVIGIPTSAGSYDYDTHYYDHNHQPGYHNYNYDKRGAIAFQIHYLQHFDIAPVEGLQWYVGGGLQARNYFYDGSYYDNNNVYHSSNANYLAAGLDLTGGAEYTFRKFPATVFAETNFFLAVVQDAGFYFQPSIGGRFNIK